MRSAMRMLTVAQYDRLVEQWNRTYKGQRASRIETCKAYGHVWRGVPVGAKEEPRLVCSCCLRYMLADTRTEATR
jgi:hypothetical protein